jgi:hypothetical protein
MKRLAMTCAILLVLLVVVGCSSGKAEAYVRIFPDVPADSPYERAINVLALSQVVTGFDAGSFLPAALVTRQQFAKVIVLAMRLPVSEGDVSHFADVEKALPGNLYPDHYVAVCAKYGITKGTAHGVFSPNQHISRAQVITMVIRAVESLRPGAVRTPPASYTSTWGVFDPTHGPAAAKAEFSGLLAGIPLDSVSPWDSMPREEVAQLLANLLVKDVTDFGARGDGQTDDTASIQAAIDHAASLGGGFVFLPSGTYLSRTLVIRSSHVVLVGEGDKSILTPADPDQSELIRIGDRPNLIDVEVRNLALFGDYSQTTQIGIAIFGLTTGKFENLTIRDVGFCGIFARPATDLTINACTITHCGDFGVQAQQGSQRVRVTNCTMSGFISRLYPSHGIYFLESTDCTAENNVISDVQRSPNTYEVSGIKFSLSSGYCSGNTITNSVAGISLPGSHNVIVENNICRQLSNCGILVIAKATDCIIRGNVIDSAPVGIQLSRYVHWPSSIRLVNNMVLNCPTPLDLAGGSPSMIVELSGNSWQD